MDIPAVVLAGGQARRMGGGDKALRLLRGRTLLDHVLDRLRPQVGALAINANGDASRFAAWGLPVLPDPLPDHPGPLAGILAGMRWAAAAGLPRVLSVPTDTPALPADLAARLAARWAESGEAIVCAASGGRRHPVVALWPVALAESLSACLTAGRGSVAAFAQAHGLAEADFAIVGSDPFTNINDMAELAAFGGRHDAR